MSKISEKVQKRVPKGAKLCQRVENVPGWKKSRGGKCPGVENVPGWKMSRGGKGPGVENVPGWKRSRGGKRLKCAGVANVRGGKASGWKKSRGGNCLGVENVPEPFPVL